MINQTVITADKSVFAPIQSNGVPYAIIKPITTSQNDEVEVEKEKKEHKFGKGIAVAALATGFGLLLLAQGLPKGARLKVSEIFRKLDAKSSNLSKNKANLTTLQNFYLKTINKAKQFTKFINCYFNFVPLKDAWPRVKADSHPFMKKIWDGISNTFEKVSVMTCSLFYGRTNKKFQKLYGELAKINSSINPEKAVELNKQIEKIKIDLDRGFGIEARINRLAQSKKDMGDIHLRFYEKTLAHPGKTIKDPDFYTTFISENLAYDAKSHLNATLSKLKSNISISTHNHCEAIKKQLNNLDSVFGLTVGEHRKVLLDAKKALDNYNKSGSDECKNILIEKLQKLSTFSTDGNVSGGLLKSIDLLGQKADKGEIQKLMEEYQKLLPKDEYAKLSKMVDKTLLSLDKSIDIEGDKLFDKIRDIQIGSAPMDLLGVLGSFGVVGFWLGKADDKDQRISAALKYGIPAVGAVAISLGCTLGLISGGPAIIFGLVAGKMISILGSSLDKFRKQYSQKPPTIESATNNIKQTFTQV